MKRLAPQHADLFFSHLRNLAALPSVFTRPEDVKKAMAYCKAVFQATLSDYTVHEDEGRNLVAIPRALDRNKPLLYLSAHVDTVDARADEWDAPFSPFAPFETDRELVGRGVSDCKAGVAFQLFVAELIRARVLDPQNLAFTLTFKEEGAGHKSAVHMGRALGTTLPVSDVETLLLVLENTVTTGDTPSLGLYTAEKGNFVIEVSGPLSDLQACLTQLSAWNPICIHPEEEPEGWNETLTQKGGHACSIPRAQNRLTEMILSARPTDLLLAGESDSFGVIPTTIKRGRSRTPVVHTLILSNRSFDTLASVHNQLQGITYRELKEFHISPGMDMRHRWEGSTFQKAVTSLCSPPLPVALDYNTGISDASTICNTLDPSLVDRVFPVVAGPGTRSQRNASPQRLTHGKNETFDKQSGILASSTLLMLMERLGSVTRRTA